MPYSQWRAWQSLTQWSDRDRSWGRLEGSWGGWGIHILSASPVFQPDVHGDQLLTAIVDKLWNAKVPTVGRLMTFGCWLVPSICPTTEGVSWLWGELETWLKIQVNFSDLSLTHIRNSEMTATLNRDMGDGLCPLFLGNPLLAIFSQAPNSTAPQTPFRKFSQVP